MFDFLKLIQKKKELQLLLVDPCHVGIYRNCFGCMGECSGSCSGTCEGMCIENCNGGCGYGFDNKGEADILISGGKN